MQSITNLVGRLQKAETELILDLQTERGRIFSSDREAWAQIKENLERLEAALKQAKKVHDTMWDNIKDKNGDAYNALAQELEREAEAIAAETIIMQANAKISTLTAEDILREE